jgi:WD40 repeat protein
MSRFKVSKYKNALCRPFKKEDWIHDLNVGSNFKSNSTHIKASCHYVAFIHSSSCSGAAAILPLNSSGRFSSFPTVSGHTGSVTDFDFSPFDDNALVTGGEEGVVKMWQLPSDPSQCGTGQSFVCSASIGPMQGGGHIEKLSFNPVASNVLGGTAGKNVYIWDMNTQQEKYMFSQHDNVVQSFSWDGAGNLLTTIAKKDKQKQLIVIDPRANAVVTVS